MASSTLIQKPSSYIPRPQILPRSPEMQLPSCDEFRTEYTPKRQVTTVKQWLGLLPRPPAHIPCPNLVFCMRLAEKKILLLSLARLTAIRHSGHLPGRESDRDGIDTAASVPSGPTSHCLESSPSDQMVSSLLGYSLRAYQDKTHT